VKKLDTLPPGQQATSSIPKAIPGLIGRMAISNTVMRGSNINCENNPVATIFFCFTNSAKCVHLISNATPNMMMAQQILSALRLAEEK